ncbi:MAG: tyrosine-type recombinase/integrase [Ktedonobacterales bacterium]
MARTKISEVWSYSTGERGRNRVRAYERVPRGSAARGLVFLEFVGLGPDGTPHRKRISLGACAREEAKAKADALAAKFAETGRPVDRQAGMVAALFDMYEREVTPSKSRHVRTHDRATAALLLRSVGRKRTVASLNRRDWDKFIRDRRSGVLRPSRSRPGHRVRERMIQYDCKLILAVLNWGMTVNDADGEPLVARNPFRGLPMPREESPCRPPLGETDYQALLGAAATIHWQFRLALVLAHETGHRIGAIRMLRWSDVDVKAARIRWRAENDKIGFEHTTPITAAAVTELETARARAASIGGTWVFAAPEQPGEPTSRYTLRHWWDTAETKAALAPVERRGWHSLRRKFATELKRAPLRDLAYLGGWKSVATVVGVYQQPDEATMQDALAQRRPLEVAARG